MSAPRGRFTASLKRPRKQTAAEWIATADSDARLMYNRARSTLAYDLAFGADAGADERQAVADNIDTDDLANAEKLVREVRLRVVHLDGSATTFPDAAQAARLHAMARALQHEAWELEQRIAAFAPHALPAAEVAGDEELTAEQAAVVANPPVLREMRRVDGRGAPYLGLAPEDIELLFIMWVDWRWPQPFIADLLHCSTRKLRSLFESLGVSRRADEAAIEAVVVAHMNLGADGLGIRKAMGELAAMGVPHTWEAVARILRATDPNGTDQRYRRRVPRVVYNNFVVNRLWHFDGYEHLVKWGFYFHGVVCGASRRIVALNAVDNKFAAPVVAFMITAFIEHGLPHMLRCDRGSENVGVVRVALLLRELGYKIRCIEGTSTRNVRIERSWGDFCPYVGPIASVLEALGEDGVLLESDAMHLLALHLVMLPFLNIIAKLSMESWNHHRMGASSPGMGCSPQHKFDVGVAQQVRSGRFQRLAFNEDGSIAMAPRLSPVARADGEEDEEGDGSVGGGDAAAAAANDAFMPSPELVDIDKLATCVVRDAERTDTWRLPARELGMEESPFPWMTPPVREAIQEAVTPLLYGAGPLRAELEPRFTRTLNFCRVLADYHARGGVPSPEVVAHLVQQGM